MAREIAKRLHATGADTLCDVFGGSGAVSLNAGFTKRIYNDSSSDLAHLFRTISDPHSRVALLRVLRWMPLSRRIWSDDHRVYLAGGFSFAAVQDPIERARATLYRLLLVWGGKIKNGGFSVSTGDRANIKEVGRYRNVLKRMVMIGEHFRESVIENLDYRELLHLYGGRDNIVFFCDPPYLGMEGYYPGCFSRADHVFLAHLLTEVKNPVVCTYYDEPLIRDLYPCHRWNWEFVTVTKNCQLRHGNKPKTQEVILTKLPCAAIVGGIQEMPL